MLYSDDELSFVSKMQDYRFLVEKNVKLILTKFLTLREQEIVKDIFKHSFVKLEFSGGYQAAERKRCLIVNEDIPIHEDMFDISQYKIKFNKRYLTITHSNVLGTLMSLQLDRSLFGDIVIKGEQAYFYTTRDIEALILMEFRAINQVSIDVSTTKEVIDVETQYETKELIVASLRIDSLISHVYKLSRSVAEDLIGGNQVSRNFQVINQKASVCKKDDIISVRRHGRFIVGETLRSTKSKKIVVAIKIPIL